MVTISLRTHQPCSGTEEMMGTKLERIAEISATTPKPEFTSLYHLINAEMLLQCHKELDGNKAMGVDKVSKAEYAEHLEENITNLVERLKKKAYKPLPSLRVYIPKGNGKMRPLGIASYEDKIVQLAVKKILEAIYEPRFLNCMYGFRRNRGCHDAVKKVHYRIQNGWINYVVDADIKGFFDHMSHEWTLKFVEYYIKDPNILCLVKKYLKAGVLEDGKYQTNEVGSAQGNIISPILANIYMHHVLVLWYQAYYKKRGEGESFLVVYADDYLAGFEHKREAERYYKEMQERLSKYGLEIETSKSRLLEFGRYAKERRKRRGVGKPETFDFLGFTFYCGENQAGKFCVKPKTEGKRLNTKLKEMKQWLKYNRTTPLKVLMPLLNRKLIGHYRYYGLTYNIQSLVKFHYYTMRLLFRWMNRRSQKKSYNWEGFKQMLEYYPLVYPKRYFNLYA